MTKTNKAPPCVVHMTPCEGSMQASARIARFLAATLGLFLIDSEESLRRFTKEMYPGHHYRVLMVNGPIAFCGFRDELGLWLLQFTERLLWIQNDYTITLPPHHSYSRPTKAETPFRIYFHRIPSVSTWSTCQDTLESRQYREVQGRVFDRYINFNALTYAPFQSGVGDKPAHDRLCYYGALRQGRLDSLRRLLAGVDCDISVSKKDEATVAAWREVTEGSGVCYPKQTEHCEPWRPTNGNTYGVQPLVRWVADYRHSLYVADAASDVDFHSLANRFYEVLSTPYTLLWLDAHGETTYNQAGLKNWATYAVDDSHELKARIAAANKRNRYLEMAEEQRSYFIGRDPYKKLVADVKAAFATYMEW